MKSVRIQAFNFQIGKLGYMHKSNSARAGINLYLGDDVQTWHYLGLGFYWRVI